MSTPQNVFVFFHSPPCNHSFTQCFFPNQRSRIDTFNFFLKISHVRWYFSKLEKSRCNSCGEIIDQSWGQYVHIYICINKEWEDCRKNLASFCLSRRKEYTPLFVWLVQRLQTYEARSVVSVLKVTKIFWHFARVRVCYPFRWENSAGGGQVLAGDRVASNGDLSEQSSLLLRKAGELRTCHTWRRQGTQVGGRKQPDVADFDVEISSSIYRRVLW